MYVTDHTISGVTNSSNLGKVEIYRHSRSDCTLFTIPCHIPRVNKAILTAVLGHTQIFLRAASLLVHMLNDYSVKQYIKIGPVTYIPRGPTHIF